MKNALLALVALAALILLPAALYYLFFVPQEALVMISYPKEFTRIGFRTQGENGFAFAHLPVGINVVRFTFKGDEYAAVVKVISNGENHCDITRNNLVKVIQASVYETNLNQ